MKPQTLSHAGIYRILPLVAASQAEIATILQLAEEKQAAISMQNAAKARAFRVLRHHRLVKMTQD